MDSKIMNKFFKIILIALLLTSEKKVSAEESAVQVLNQNFKKVDISNGNLSITMNDFGQRYVYDPDGKNSDLSIRLLEYGETVTLNRGFKKAALYYRHLVLTFSRLENIENAYELAIDLDQRSMGGKLVEIKTNFLIKAKSIEDVIATPKKDKASTSPSVDDNSAEILFNSPTNIAPDIKPSLTPPSSEKPSSPSRLLIAALIAAGIAILCVFLRRLNKKL